MRVDRPTQSPNNHFCSNPGFRLGSTLLVPASLLFAWISLEGQLLDVGDFVILEQESSWTYEGSGTASEGGISGTIIGTVLQTTTDGGTFHGTETTEVSRIGAVTFTTQAGSQSFNEGENLIFSLNGNLLLHQTGGSDETGSFFETFENPVAIMPSQISVGESFPFAGNYTYEAGTGTGSITNGSVTIDGIEIVETVAGTFETLKVTISNDYEESNPGFTAEGTSTQIWWLARNIGIVQLQVIENETSTDGNSTQDVIFTLFSSNRDVTPLPVVEESDPFGGIPLGDGWFFSEWYGIYNTAFYPWIFHSEHGWQYIFLPAQSDSVSIYDLEANEIWWTSSTFLPVTFFSFGRDAFIFYFTGTTSPRSFVVLATEVFFTIP